MYQGVMQLTRDPYSHYLGPDERERIREDLTEKLQSHEQIVFAYVFGSFLSPGSFRDVDVAIYVDEKAESGGVAWDLAEALSEELSDEYKLVFDVILLNRAPQSFQCKVFEEGEVLFARNEGVLTDMIENASLACIRDEAFSFLAGHGGRREHLCSRNGQGVSAGRFKLCRLF
jgi:hypothetical protein